MTTLSRGVELSFDDIHVAFGTAYQLDLSHLRVPAGQITALLGPSGCGKSTLLNLAAGYLPAQAGTVSHDGVPLQGPAPQTAFLFQQRNLFPWMSAEDNICFALENQGVATRLAKAEARGLLASMGLQEYAGHYPAELSGGMQQRVVLARALAVRPRMFLMDEPFSALDTQTRQQMYRHILRAWEDIGATFLIVTHDVRDALELAHQVVVMQRHPTPGVKKIVPLTSGRPGGMSLERQHTFIETIYQGVQFE